MGIEEEIKEDEKSKRRGLVDMFVGTQRGYVNRNVRRAQFVRCREGGGHQAAGLDTGHKGSRRGGARREGSGRRPPRGPSATRGRPGIMPGGAEES